MKIYEASLFNIDILNNFQMICSVFYERLNMGWDMNKGTWFYSLWSFKCTRGGVAGWCEGVVYLMSLGRPIDIG